MVTYKSLYDSFISTFQYFSFLKYKPFILEFGCIIDPQAYS